MHGFNALWEPGKVYAVAVCMWMSVIGSKDNGLAGSISRVRDAQEQQGFVCPLLCVSLTSNNSMSQIQPAQNPQACCVSLILCIPDAYFTASVPYLQSGLLVLSLVRVQHGHQFYTLLNFGRHTWLWLPRFARPMLARASMTAPQTGCKCRGCMRLSTRCMRLST